MLRHNLIFTVLLFWFLPSYGYCDTIDDLASKFSIDRSSAEQLVTGIFATVRGVQNGISQIADSDIPVERKTGSGNIIDTLLDEYFESGDARIYVSSLNGNNSIAYPARRYFSHLATLSDSKKYTSVKVYFDKDLKLTNIYSDSNNMYASTDVWQVFKGCGTNYEGIESCYKDVTKKTINITISKSNFTTKVKEIGVGDTLTYEEAKGMIGTILKY